MKWLKRLRFKYDIWQRRRKLRKKSKNKPKPGTFHTVGNRTYYVHENGSLERMND